MPFLFEVVGVRVSFQDGVHRLYGKARITFCTDGRRTVLNKDGRCGICDAEVTGPGGPYHGPVA